MSLLCVGEAIVASIIVWKALVKANHMTKDTHHGIRAGWVLAGSAAAWWGLAALAGDPIRSPLVLTVIGFAIAANADRRSGNGHA